MKKRLLAMLLTLVMILSLFPASAFAEGDVEETSVIPAEEAAMEAEAEGETGADPAGESVGSIPEPSGEELSAGADPPGGPIEPVGTIPESPAEESYTKDGVLDDPSADPNALPEVPVADELQAVTDSGSCGDNLTWSLENNVLTISGNGAMTNWSSSSNVPWYDYRETIAEIVLPEGLTTVGRYAFSGCKYVTGVTIPSGVTSIGNSAFYNCSSLTSVEIPSGVTSIGNSAFSDCSSLTSVTIPQGVTSIGIAAFDDCSSLTSVTIPSSVTSIGERVFSGCSGLKSVEIPSGVTSIGSRAFYNCYRLTSVTIPSSVTSIGGSAFYSCDKIRAVYIDDLDWWLRLGDSSVSELPHSDLYLNGEAVTEIIVPEGILGLRPYMFANMSSLQSVTLPSGLRTVGNSAFSGCSGLKTVFFLGDAPSFGSKVFGSWNNQYVRATALYSVDNETWTTEKRQSYGASSLTWLGYRDVAAAYTIHYDANGGSNAPEDQFKGHGVDVALTSSTPSRSNESAGSYTVILDANGGSVNSSSLTAPLTASYTFREWNSQEDGSGDSYTSGANFARNEDTTLYAQWDRSISTERISLPSPSRTRYSFRGWATDPNANSGFTGYYTPEKNITLYAIWSINTYTITYNANGGSGAPASQTKTYGVDLTLTEEIPTRTGYDFQGWATTSYGSVAYAPGATYTNNSNVTLYAVWAIQAYAVHLDPNGGLPGYSDHDTNSDFSEDLTKVYGQSLRLDGYVHKAGHRFLGWARDPDATQPEFQPYDYYYDDEPITLFAVWQIYTYPVVYITGKDIEGPEPQVKTWGVDLVLSDMIPQAEGYDFMGWSLYNQSNIPDYQPGDTYSGNGNGYEGSQISFYAVWQLKSYVVVYKANGGEDAPDAQIKLHGRALTLSEEIPVREGYVFLGWSTNRKATEPEYLPGGSYTNNKSASLYAIWEPEKDRPMFRVGEGSASAGRQVDIPIRLEHNPGIYALTVSFSYDTSALELVAVTPNRDAFPGSWQTASLKGATWMSNAGDIAADETIMTLSFLVKEETEEGDYAVNVSLGEIVNEALDDIRFGTGSGKVTVTSHLPGDVNGDGSVTTKDFVVLMKYLAGEEVAVDESALDINGDGNVTTKDFVILMRYVAGEDVVIY